MPLQLTSLLNTNFLNHIHHLQHHHPPSKIQFHQTKIQLPEEKIRVIILPQIQRIKTLLPFILININTIIEQKKVEGGESNWNEGGYRDFWDRKVIERRRENAPSPETESWPEKLSLGEMEGCLVARAWAMQRPVAADKVHLLLRLFPTPPLPSLAPPPSRSDQHHSTPSPPPSSPSSRSVILSNFRQI